MWASQGLTVADTKKITLELSDQAVRIVIDSLRPTFNSLHINTFDSSLAPITEKAQVKSYISLAPGEICPNILSSLVGFLKEWDPRQLQGSPDSIFGTMFLRHAIVPGAFRRECA